MKKFFTFIIVFLMSTLLITSLALADTLKIKAEPNWLEQANQIAGTNVWIKATYGNLCSEHYNTFTNLEEVTVLEIKREASYKDDYINDGYKMPKYIIKIQKSDGTICILGSNIIEINYFYKVKELFYTENPYKKYDWPEYVWNLIRNQKIIIGMNQDQAIMAWGYPKDINKDVGSWGVHEQWVYNNQYLYFKNGILNSYQN